MTYYNEVEVERIENPPSYVDMNPFNHDVVAFINQEGTKEEKQEVSFHSDNDQFHIEKVEKVDAKQNCPKKRQSRLMEMTKSSLLKMKARTENQD